MSFLPIVARELRVAARRRGTYWNRLGAAAIALIIGGWILLVTHLNPHEFGMALFVGLSVLVFLYALVAGLKSTFDCVSEEKREGTLGLLFLTDLRGYDVVFGKLTASSLNAFYGLLAVFPVMAISLLAGGVTLGEFWRVVLASLNLLFFSLAVGMFMSSVSRDERKSAFGTVAIVIVLALGTWVLTAYLAYRYRANRIEPFLPLLLPNPTFSCVFAFDAMRRTLAPPEAFYWSLLTVHAMSWGLLGLASVITPRTWQDKAQRQQRKSSAADHSTAQRRKAFRTHLLERNPFFWLAAREQFKPALVWVMLVILAVLWLLAWRKWDRDWAHQACYVFTAITLHSIIKIWLTTEACRRIALDRQSGALELLLSTPLRVPQILRGQEMALWRQFGWPSVAILLLDFVFLLLHRSDSDWVILCLIGMSVFVADLVTLAWVGMWLGVSSRQYNRAAGSAGVRVLVLPWLAYGLLNMFVVTLNWATNSSEQFWTDSKFQMFLWFALSLVNNLGFGLAARQRLLMDFRAMAAQRYTGGGPSVWRRWFSELFPR